MFERVRELILHVLRVPPEPHPPAGASGSLRAFRAARNFYRLRVAGWALTQAVTAAGILFSIGALRWLEREVTDLRAADAARAATAAQATASAPPAPAADPAATDGKGAAKAAEPRRRTRNRGGFVRMVERMPGWVLPAVKVFEAGAILLYLALIPVTYGVVRLDYEYRWYLVTDRSLRIRTGIWRLQESTMSFANLQQVVVAQGPVQRLLGVADVRVQSAGGGGGDEKDGREGSLHEAVFHGVDNAFEIRDLILDRLRRFREAGLGDPDDHAASAAGDALAAAQAVLAEARALRQALH